MFSNINITTIFSIAATILGGIASIFAIKMYKARMKYEIQAREIAERQKQTLNQLDEFGRQFMTQTLKMTPQVAFSPYPQLFPNLAPSDISLFDRRRSHFKPEKDKLCETVVENIRKQIDREVGGVENLTIILILDAGSTVFPMFHQLCVHPAFQFDKHNASRLKIITNNLPGVSELIKYGRIGDPIRARTLFKCRILSGYAHSQYEASLSPQTSIDLLEAVEEFKKDISEQRQTNQVKIISVVTGNYLSIPDGILARDSNHISTKSAMLDAADEVYVLAPLGKWLPFSKDDINGLLGLSGLETYGTLNNWSEKMNIIRLVVTTRHAEYFSKIDPPTLSMHLGRVQAEIRDRYGKNQIYVPFDPTDNIEVKTTIGLLGESRALREYEFPHRNLRESLIYWLEKND